MSSAVPKEIRDRIRQKIWDKANDLGWPGLSDVDRAMWYENWTKDKDIGGVLTHFMDARRVRVYIKDSLLKPYLRTRLEESAEKVLIAAGISQGTALVSDTYEKPHGRLLKDGKIICWGHSRDWKTIVISVFERAHRLANGQPYAAVLVDMGRITNSDTRALICEVGKKLGLDRVVWID